MHGSHSKIKDALDRIHAHGHKSASEHAQRAAEAFEAREASRPTGPLADDESGEPDAVASTSA